MVFTPLTPIVGTGSVSAAAIDSWYSQQGPIYAPNYAPDRTYRPAPATLGADIIRAAQPWGVNWNVMAAQILHESAAWQSRIVRDKNNPSGLGAVDDNAYGGAITFATPFEGIRATAAHLMTYAAGTGDWTQHDPRASATPPAWRGTVTTWGALGGKWATDAGYGQRVTALANNLMVFASTSGGSPMPPTTSAVPIRVVYLPDGASNRPGYPMTPRFVTIHETANTATGANAEMHSRYLAGLAQAGKGEPSWHFTVDDHEIVQHLPTTENGWHAGDGAQGTGNRASIGIELCVNSDGNFTRTQHNAAWLVAKLIRDQASLAGNVLANEVVQHNHWSGKDCPHTIRATPGGWATFLALVAAELQAPAPSPGPPDDELVVNGVPIIAGFRALWESVPVEEDRYRIFGLPLAAEHSVAGTALEADYGIVSIQSYERCGWFVYQPAEGWTCTVAHHDLWPALEAAG